MNKRILSLFIFFLPFSSFAKDKICHLGDKEIDGVPACGVKVAFFGTVSLSYKYDLSKHSYPLCERFGEENIKKRYTFISTRGEKAGQRLTPEIRRTQKKKECRNKVGDFYKKRFYMVGFEEEELGAALVFSEKVEVEDFKSYYKDFDFKKVEGSELENFKKRLKKLEKTGAVRSTEKAMGKRLKWIEDGEVSVRQSVLKKLIGDQIAELVDTGKGVISYPSEYLLFLGDNQVKRFHGTTGGAVSFVYLLGEFKYMGIRYVAFGGTRESYEIELVYKINGKIYTKTVHDINDHLTF